MDPTVEQRRWSEVERLYHEASSCDATQRADLLCNLEPSLRAEIESLLAANELAGGFLDQEAREQVIGELSRQHAPIERLGHYRVLERIGGGGMSDVYLAEDVRLGRKVALKLLAPEFVNSQERLRRFLHEGKAASSLNHPNIVTVYEAGDEGGISYIAAEFVEGQTLAQRVADGPLALAECLRIAHEAASALAVAHAAGVVHRDIKPENIMVRNDGLVKVLDFGIARSTELLPAQVTRTHPGAILGTPRYMSPEQARGQQTDARTDVFSLAAVIYEIASGRPAFPGKTVADQLAAILHDETPTLAIRGSSQLDAVLKKAMSKDREHRYASMAAFLEDLDRLSGGRRISIEAAAPNRQRLRLRIAAALLVALMGAGGYFLYLQGRDRNAGPQRPQRIVPLGSFPGAKIGLSFSSDGNRIAFCWNDPSERPGSSHVYVKTVGAGEPQRLTNDRYSDSVPSWSPDGRYIAFMRIEPAGPTGLYVVPAAGGTERRVADAATGISWLPDSKQIAVSVAIPGKESTGIALIPLAGGPPRLLTDTEKYTDNTPSISFDGKRIAFVRNFTPSSRELMVAELGSDSQLHDLRQWTHDNRVISSVAWNANGREVVFTSNRGGQMQIWRIAGPGESPRLVETGATAMNVATTRDGRRLAYVMDFTDSNIYEYRSAGLRSGLPSLFTSVAKPLFVSSREDHSAALSPDGTRVAFVSNRSGAPELWIGDESGGPARQLTTWSAPSTGSPKWSPDGKWIVFDSTAGFSNDLYVIAAEGGKPRRLTFEDSAESQPFWSTDGRFVFYVSNRNGGRSQIWRIPVEGGEQLAITKGVAGEGKLSPDGKTIYFRRGIFSKGLSSVGVNGQDERAIPEFADIPVRRLWAVAKDGIYFFVKESEQSGWVRFFSFATRRFHDVLKLDKPPIWDLPCLEVSPDGRQLLYSAVDSKIGDLMMIENFR